MLTLILDVIALVAGIIPPFLWVLIILGLTLLSGCCLDEWFVIPTAFILLVLAWKFLHFVLSFVPNWIQLILLIGLIIAFIWTKK